MSNKSIVIFIAFFGGYLTTAHAANLEVVEHDVCNELRLNDSNDRVRWNIQSEGGSQTVNSYSFKSLNTNSLDSIQFGRDSKISFKFNGKNFVPDAITASQNFGLEVEALFDDASSSVVGKFIGFIDNDRATRFFPDKTAQYGSRDRLLMAVIYVNPSLESVPSIVPCDYVSSDLTPELLNSAKCLWVDQASRPSNGKPYCW